MLDIWKDAFYYYLQRKKKLLDDKFNTFHKSVKFFKDWIPTTNCNFLMFYLVIKIDRFCLQHLILEIKIYTVCYKNKIF